MRRVILVLVVVAASHFFAFQPSRAGSSEFFWILGGSYLLLTVLALHHFVTERNLAEKLAPRWGDISIGVVTATALFFASFLSRRALAPAGTDRAAWIFRIYLQLGDPEILQHSVSLSGTLLGLAVMEELVWRGMVLDQVATRFGSRRGWIVAALLYALAVSPTLVALRDPVAGPNPLLFTAALGMGIVFSFLTARLGRLPPVILAHAAFSYFSAVQFRWPA